MESGWHGADRRGRAGRGSILARACPGAVTRSRSSSSSTMSRTRGRLSRLPRHDLAGRRVVALVLDGSGESTSGAALRLDERVRFHLDALAGGIGRDLLRSDHAIPRLQMGRGRQDDGLGGIWPTRPCAAPAIIDDRRTGRPGSHTAELSPRLSHIALRESLLDALRGKFGPRPPSAPDFARAGQSELESRVLAYASELLTDDIDVLIYAGGVALNCTANMALAALCRDRDAELLVPPVASDTGVAIGAAAAVSTRWARLRHGADPGLGRTYPADAMGRALRVAGLADGRCRSGQGCRPAARGEDRSVVRRRQRGRASRARAPFAHREARFGGHSGQGQPGEAQGAMATTGSICQPVPVRQELRRIYVQRLHGGSRRECAVGGCSSSKAQCTSTAPPVPRWSPQAARSARCWRPWAHARVWRRSSTPRSTSLAIPLRIPPRTRARAARQMRLDFLAGDGWVAEITA